jgi:hypothetical protein
MDDDATVLEQTGKQRKVSEVSHYGKTRWEDDVQEHHPQSMFASEIYDFFSHVRLDNNVDRTAVTYLGQHDARLP